MNKSTVSMSSRVCASIYGGYYNVYVVVSSEGTEEFLNYDDCYRRFLVLRKQYDHK